MHPHGRPIFWAFSASTVQVFKKFVHFSYTQKKNPLFKRVFCVYGGLEGDYYTRFSVFVFFFESREKPLEIKVFRSLPHLTA